MRGSLDRTPESDDSRHTLKFARLGIRCAAVRIARLGWPVLPLHGAAHGVCTCGNHECKSPGKHPVTRAGLKEATLDEATIIGWFPFDRSRNVGILTGAESGLVVLDIDPKSGGNEGLESLEAALGQLPPTITVTTGGGGRHLYFKHPGLIVRNSAGKLAPGVDVRGDRGYVVAPPSMHAAGTRYSWQDITFGTPDRLASLPDAWLARMRSAPATPAAESTTPQVILEGHRNTSLTSIAGKMRRNGAVAEEILEQLRDINANRCLPPLSDGELRRIASGMTRYPTLSVTAQTEWQIPASIRNRQSPPSFPLDSAFPAPLGVVRDFIESLAESLQVPIDLPAMMLLPIVATAGAQKFEVSPRQGWREVCAIWTLALLKPAERKSPVISMMTQPILEWEAEELRRLQPAIARYDTERQLNKSRCRKLIEKSVRHGAIPSEEQKREIETIEIALRTSEPPHPPHIVAGEPTTEALGALLAKNDERMLIASAEAGALEIMLGRYSRKPNMGVYLAGHTGDAYRIERLNRPPDHLRRPALSIALAIQPDAVRELLRNRSAEGHGLLGRFLYAIPESRLGSREIRPTPLPERLQSEYGRMIRLLLDLPLPSEQNPTIARFDTAASECFDEFQARIELDLRENGRLGDATDFGGKHCGAIARIALVLHLLEMAGRNCFRGAETIPSSTVEAAIAWSDYLIQMREVAFGSIGLDPNIRVAERMISFLAESGLETVTRREFWSQLKDKRHVARTADLDGPIDLLIEYHYLRPIDPLISGSRDRRTSKYSVNPRLRERRTSDGASAMEVS